MHLGHRYLLQQLRDTAQRLQLEPAVVTFRSHPKLILTGSCPPLLTTTDERLALLSRYTDYIICLDFPSVQSLTAEAFMRKLHDEYDVQVLLMGYDHHFGSDRLASIDDYILRGRKAGIQVILQEQAPEGAVSSTRIRRAITEGNIAEANRLLGYPYFLSGTVVHGRGLGRQLGFPTANIQADAHKLIPAARRRLSHRNQLAHRYHQHRHQSDRREYSYHHRSTYSRLYGQSIRPTSHAHLREPNTRRTPLRIARRPPSSNRTRHSVPTNVRAEQKKHTIKNTKNNE